MIPSPPYLNKNTLETAGEGGGAHFEDEISQLIALALSLHLGILALLVIVFQFVHQAVKQRVSSQTQACVSDSKTGGRLLAVVQNVDCLWLGCEGSAKDNS